MRMWEGKEKTATKQNKYAEMYYTDMWERECVYRRICMCAARTGDCVSACVIFYIQIDLYRNILHKQTARDESERKMIWLVVMILYSGSIKLGVEC